MMNHHQKHEVNSCLNRRHWINSWALRQTPEMASTDG
jgi:hypothetical protein